MRETSLFETSTGRHKATLHTYLTRGERREIKNALMGGIKIEFDEKGKTNSNGFDLSNTDLSEDKLFELAIVDLDGDPDNIVDRILVMRDTEVDEIKAEIERLTGGDATAKKDDGAATTQS